MTDTLLNIDRGLFLMLNFDGGPFLDALFRIVSRKETWVPLYLVILWFIYRRHGWRYMLAAALVIVLCVAAADQTCNFFKHHTPKLRPTHTDTLRGLVHTVRGYTGGLYGTVSAHAATTLSIALVTSRIFRKRWYGILIFCWCALICYSRIYLGVHFPFDIMFGLVTGASVGWLGITLLRYLDRRFLGSCEMNSRS